MLDEWNGVKLLESVFTGRTLTGTFFIPAELNSVIFLVYVLARKQSRRKNLPRFQRKQPIAVQSETW